MITTIQYQKKILTKCFKPFEFLHNNPVENRGRKCSCYGIKEKKEVHTGTDTQNTDRKKFPTINELLISH